MSFTYSLSTNTGKIRLAIGDTSSSTGAGVKPDGSNFSDEELAVFIDAAIAAGQTWRSAVAPVLHVLANQFAANARSLQFADYREDFTQTAAALRAQAAAWEQGIDTSGAAVAGLSAGVITLDSLYYTMGSNGEVT